MNSQARILTEPFTEGELELVLRAYPEKRENLLFYNSTNYFQISKVYYKELLMGYVIFFLGYHSLESEDVSIEDIGFFRNEEFLKPFMTHLLDKVKRHKVPTYPMEHVYYDPNKFGANYLEIFESLEFIPMEKKSCRGYLS